MIHRTTRVIKRAVPPFHLRWWKWLRLGIFLALDILTISGAYWAAFLLRFDGDIPARYQMVASKTLFVLVLSNVLAFFFGGLYRQVWRYANLNSGIRIARSLMIGTIMAIPVNVLVFPDTHPPRSVLIIFWLTCFVLISAVRFSWRLWAALQAGLDANRQKRTLIYGAGSGGDILARHILSHPGSGYKLVGFIDDDKNKWGRLVHGLRIFGGRSQLREACEKYRVDTVIIGIPTASGKTVQGIVSEIQQLGIRPLIMPDLQSTLDAAIIKPRPIDIRDLLKRSPRSIDQERVARYFHKCTVLITGAGGSIGSEISRQVCDCNPSKIILLDNSEYNLYRIEAELRNVLAERGQQTEIVPVLGSVTDEALVDACFQQHRPSIVLHAAAYKHVPMLEQNSLQAVLNNVLGTKILTEASIRFGVERFLLISTDKAVRPTSVMGASKRCCELLIQALYQATQSLHAGSYCIVRFGNVLGSSGSVVPTFIEQIEKGGPVTVTDPEMTRYFMLISEAVGLVLQSISVSRGGEVFILNMGEPVRILDMATQLILLYGKRPGQDIEIKFTGIRPGEKLYEELILEGIEHSVLKGDVFVADPVVLDSQTLLDEVEQLIELARASKTEACARLVKEIAKSERFVLTRSQTRNEMQAAQLQ